MLETATQERRKVYPIGYGRLDALQSIATLMEQPQMLLIDTRFRPGSRWPQWREAALRARYGSRYRWAGAYLGNTHFQGGPITLANPEEGIRGLCMYLDEGYDLILLCQCPSYHTCHRKIIVGLLLQQRSVEVIHQASHVLEATIPALSIRQPYAHWLAHPDLFREAGITPKTIENRNWVTHYRGPLLLHASSTFDHDAIAAWVGRYPQLERVVPLEEKGYPTGTIVGSADLVDVVRQSQNPWFVGPYGFVVEHARPLEPISYRGQLKLFPVPVSLVHTCHAAPH